MKNIFGFILSMLLLLFTVTPVVVILLPIIITYLLFLCLFKLVTLLFNTHKMNKIYNKTEEFGFVLCSIPVLVMYPVVGVIDNFDLF
jgi:hypothetical protein